MLSPVTDDAITKATKDMIAVSQLSINLDKIDSVLYLDKIPFSTSRPRTLEKRAKLFLA